jgi:mRNA deadenylase 3'-5' endonuclease subunit Ccr4/uncharacterized protein with PIN domain
MTDSIESAVGRNFCVESPSCTVNILLTAENVTLSVNRRDIQSKDSSFRVSSWNCLSDHYARVASFPYCEASTLQWPHRHKLISAVLESEQHKADIFCLQEVDVDNLGSFWSNYAFNNNFGFIYAKRPQFKRDGCLLLFNQDKFNHVHIDISSWPNSNINANIEYCQINGAETNSPEAIQVYHSSQHHRDNQSGEACIVVDMNNLSLSGANPHYKRSNIALICLFQLKGCPSRYILAINTHIYWNPIFPAIKLLQVIYLLEQIQLISTRLKQQLGPENLGIVLCGDFNSLPSSDVYSLLLRGHVTPHIQCEIPENHSKFSSGTLKNEHQAEFSQKSRFLVDSSLLKVCKWLRAVGFDCLYYPGSSSAELSALSSAENRLIITQNKQLGKRRNCPPHFLSENKTALGCFREILRFLAINQWNLALFYSRCTSCNGLLADFPLEIFKTLGFVPFPFSSGLDIHGKKLCPVKCDGECGRIRWWQSESTKEEKIALFLRRIDLEDNDLNEENDDLSRNSTKQCRNHGNASANDRNSQDKPAAAAAFVVVSSQADSGEQKINRNGSVEDKLKRRAEKKRQKLMRKEAAASKLGAKAAQNYDISGELVSFEFLSEEKHAGESNSGKYSSRQANKSKCRMDTAQCDPVAAELLENWQNCSHRINLRSSYGDYRALTASKASSQQLPAAVGEDEPQYTNSTNKFQGTLDYLLYESDCLELVNITALPSAEAATLPLPALNWPSDHLCLTAQFSFR